MQLKIDFPQTFFFFFSLLLQTDTAAKTWEGKKNRKEHYALFVGHSQNAVAASLQHSTQIRSPAARQEMKHGHNAQAECIQSPRLHPLRTDIISVSSKRRHN